MTGSSAILLFVFSITVIVFLTVKLKVNSALVLLAVSLIAAMFCSMSLADAVNTVRSGFGSTAGYVGIIILEGVMIAVILEKTGALASISGFFFKRGDGKKTEIGAALAGYAVSVPVSCDSAYLLLSPAVNSYAEAKGKSVAVISVMFSSGLYITHCLVPPTSGPLSAIGILYADTALVTILGLLAGLAGLAGAYFWTVKFVAGREFTPQFDYHPEKNALNNETRPGVLLSVIPLIFPLVLMILRSAALLPFRPFGSSSTSKMIIFAGDPVVSLLAGILFAFFLVRKTDLKNAAGEWIAEAVKRGAPLVILAGAGGAFGAVIKASMITNALVNVMHGWHIGIFLPFIIAASLKTATGSSTVSIITASSVTAPLTASLGINPSIAVLAVCSGSMMLSHVNDPYFWIVSRLSGMDERTAFRFFTPATAVCSITSFAVVMILSFFIK